MISSTWSMRPGLPARPPRRISARPCRGYSLGGSPQGSLVANSLRGPAPLLPWVRKCRVHGFTFRAGSTLTASPTKLPRLARQSPSSEFWQEDGRKVADVFPTCGPSINDRVHLARVTGYGRYAAGVTPRGGTP